MGRGKTGCFVCLCLELNHLSSQRSNCRQRRLQLCAWLTHVGSPPGPQEPPSQRGVLCQEAVCGLRSQCPREPANKAAAGPTPGALETCLRVTLAANPPALLPWLLPAVPGWWVEHSSEAGKPHPDHRGSVPLSVGPSASSKSRQSLQTQPCPQCPHHRFVHPHNQTRKTHRPAPRGASAEEGTVTGPSYK